MSELSTNPHNSDTIVTIAQQIVLNQHPIEIRPVREEEIHHVADIITRSFHFDRGWMSWFTPLFRLGIAEDLRNRLRPRLQNANQHKIQQQVCSIAVYQDQAQAHIAGTVEVGVRTAERYRQKQHRYVYLSNLAVSKDFRRLGVAQELIGSCEQITIDWGYSELHLHVMGDNERGRNLYQKLGYEIVSSDAVWSIIPWHRPERLFLRKQLVD
jgi:ribosomal protein S18 acetylase RimI-like enzyme